VRARIAVLASLLAHACIAWLATHPTAVPESRPSQSARPVAQVARLLSTQPAGKVEPLEVILLDPDSLASTAAPAPSASREDSATSARPMSHVFASPVAPRTAQAPAASTQVAGQPPPVTRRVAAGSAQAAASTAPDPTALPAPASAPSPKAAITAVAGGARAIDEARPTGTQGNEPSAVDGHARSLAMRGPDLALHEPFLERIAHGGSAPEAIVRSGRVDPAGGGTAVIEDKVTTVHIARDGTVTFEDKPDFEINIDLPIPTPSRIKRYVAAQGRQIAKWYADPYAQMRVGTIHDVPAHLAAQPGACDHYDDPCDQAMRALQRKPGDRPALAPIWGKLEITDALMRRFVGDPYSSRKRKLLDDSRAERAEMRAQHHAEDIARSSELTQRNLEALWRATHDPAVWRDLLFAMWDECAEGDDPDGEAGQRARLMIIGWIRAKLPAGAPGAFTPDEIAARSAHRQSRQAFSPYE
jgi:hypothetical protein